MSKKIIENEVPLNYKEKTEPDFVVKIPTITKHIKDNKEPIITEVYKVKTGSLLDTNTNTSTTVLETKLIKEEEELKRKSEEIYRKTQKKFLDEIERIKNNPFNFQTIGRAIRLKGGDSLLGSRTGKGSFRLRSSRETADYVNTVIKNLCASEKVQRPAQLIEKFKTSKLVRTEFSSQQTYIEAGMVLKRLGVTPQEILTLVCERILQRKDLRQRYLSKNTPSLTFGMTPKLEGQAGYELVYQWYLIRLQNKKTNEINWKKRPPTYKKNKFYESKWFNDWLIKYNIPKPSTYSNFVKFINTTIKDYKKFCRQNRIQILPLI